MEWKTEEVLKVDEAGRVWTPRELRDAFDRSGTPETQFAARVGREVSDGCFAGEFCIA